MLFNHTLIRLGEDSYLLEYDDAFEIRQSTSIPYDKNIRIGGTASAGNLFITIGKVVGVDESCSRGVSVLTADNSIIDCYKVDDIRIGDMVNVYEHMSLQSSNFGQFDFVAARKLPVFINLHSINIDYSNGRRIYIDPHTHYMNDQV